MMLEYEQQLWDSGYSLLAGVDEVGRGCLFGDVIAAAVVLPKDQPFHEEIRDSKKLTAKKREQLYEEIQRCAISIGIGRVDARTIDQINIKQAARLAMKLAVLQLNPTPDHLLVDAEKIDCEIPQIALIKGDDRSQAIAAASIIAKVTRDRLCVGWGQLYPEYGIEQHKGYATRQHREAILTFGASALHRRSFLTNLLNQQLEFEQTE